MTDKLSIKLEEVAYVPKSNSNLILLEQLPESEITYVDNPDSMTLMQKGQVIAHVKREENLFTRPRYSKQNPSGHKTFNGNDDLRPRTIYITH